MQIRTTIKCVVQEAHLEGMREVEGYSVETRDPRLAISNQTIDYCEVENKLLGMDLEYRAYFYVFGVIRDCIGRYAAGNNCRLNIMIKGVNHITLSIKDVEESFEFYSTVLGCQPIARWPQGAYLLAGDIWLALVLDDKTRDEPLPEYSHIAFTVSPHDLKKLGDRLAASGVAIWQQNWTEGDSLYIVDPNGHKLEVHASDLAARLKEARIDPWPGLEFIDE